MLDKIKQLTYKEKLYNNSIIKADKDIIFQGKVNNKNQFHDHDGALYPEEVEKYRFKGKFENGKFVSGIERAYHNRVKLF
ncbi:hypothetical protein R9X47_28740 [Wukongibacter baidiensis]|uniref:hypothetical protein n=1 Tax=Wukongibacter baidiensis TaxID=1723361 RepID=UPI003D7F8003